MPKFSRWFVLMLLPVLWLLDIAYGPGGWKLPDFSLLFSDQVHADPVQEMILSFRLPKAIAAVLAGAGLALAGLLMQSFFRNPLAGPYVLGISSGATMMVAVVLLVVQAGNWTFLLPYLSGVGLFIPASLGALVILMLILFLSWRIRQQMTLLLAGVVIGQLAGAFTEILSYSAGAEALKSYIFWTAGSFASVDVRVLPWLAVLVLVSLICVRILAAPLDLYALGDDHARAAGVRVKRLGAGVLLLSGILTGTITAACGPLAFVGLAVPHLARMITGASLHRNLIVFTAACGALFCLAADLISGIGGSGGGLLPVNAVCVLLGSPVVLLVLMRYNRRGGGEQ